MRPIDQQRFVRELHGDFREADAEIRASLGKAVVFAILLAALLVWAVMMNAAFAGTVGDPYTGTPIAIGGAPGAVTMWEAENVDKGGEGIAFHSLTGSPAGCTPTTCSCPQGFRTDGLPMCGVGPGPAYVTFTGPGTWYEYTISVDTIGNYTTELLAAIGDQGCCGAAAYHVEVDGAPIVDPVTNTASIALGPTATASWNSFEWRGKSSMFPLVPGKHKLRIVVDVGWFNWDAVRMKHAGGIEWKWGPTWQVYP